MYISLCVHVYIILLFVSWKTHKGEWIDTKPNLQQTVFYPVVVFFSTPNVYTNVSKAKEKKNEKTDTKGVRKSFIGNGVVWCGKKVRQMRSNAEWWNESKRRLQQMTSTTKIHGVPATKTKSKTKKTVLLFHFDRNCNFVIFNYMIIHSRKTIIWTLVIIYNIWPLPQFNFKQKYNEHIKNLIVCSFPLSLFLYKYKCIFRSFV